MDEESDINNYDKFASLRQDELIKGEKLPHRYIEKPMMLSMLPSLENKKVLMLGCGSGEESVMLEERGAEDMVGVDSSVASIKLATETYPRHFFLVGDMHNLDFSDSEFDFVYSSLAVHYSAHPEKVYKEIFRILKQGGMFLFSVGHPIRWASEEVRVDETKTRLIGFSEDKERPRIYGKYLSFKEHEHRFPAGEILKFWVGPPSLHFSLLKSAGFVIEDFKESKAIEQVKGVDLYYFDRYTELPQFMAFLARKT